MYRIQSIYFYVRDIKLFLGLEHLTSFDKYLHNKNIIIFEILTFMQVFLNLLNFLNYYNFMLLFK